MEKSQLFIGGSGLVIPGKTDRAKNPSKHTGSGIAPFLLSINDAENLQRTNGVAVPESLPLFNPAICIMDNMPTSQVIPI